MVIGKHKFSNVDYVVTLNICKILNSANKGAE